MKILGTVVLTVIAITAFDAYTAHTINQGKIDEACRTAVIETQTRDLEHLHAVEEEDQLTINDLERDAMQEDPKKKLYDDQFSKPKPAPLKTPQPAKDGASKTYVNDSK